MHTTRPRMFAFPPFSVTLLVDAFEVAYCASSSKALSTRIRAQFAPNFSLDTFVYFSIGSFCYTLGIIPIGHTNISLFYVFFILVLTLTVLT